LGPFGQGATRCHPYALPLVKAVEDNDASAFRQRLLGWLWHSVSNFFRSKVRGLTRGFSAGSPEPGEVATYYRRLAWASSRFALLADLALYLIGSKLKIKGSLGGRFADALTWQVLAISTLRRFKEEGSKPEDLPILKYSCEFALAQIQDAFEGIHANFDVPVVGWWLRGPSSWFLRLNPLSRGPSDKLIPKTAGAIQQLNDQFRRMTDGIAPFDEEKPGMGRLMKAFRLHSEAEAVMTKIHQAQKARKLPRGLSFEVVDEALAANIISADESTMMREANAAAMAAIEVDVFSPEDYFQEA
jgi:acyl-CoA dehydrogenase